MVSYTTVFILLPWHTVPCMSTADELLDDFLSQRDNDVDGQTWEENYNKKQCPDCGGLHDTAATECTVCGWTPAL